MTPKIYQKVPFWAYFWGYKFCWILINHPNRYSIIFMASNSWIGRKFKLLSSGDRILNLYLIAFLVWITNFFVKSSLKLKFNFFREFNFKVFKSWFVSSMMWLNFTNFFFVKSILKEVAKLNFMIFFVKSTVKQVA